MIADKNARYPQYGKKSKRQKASFTSKPMPWTQEVIKPHKINKTRKGLAVLSPLEKPLKLKKKANVNAIAKINERVLNEPLLTY